MSANYGILGSHGASACTLPDTVGATCATKRCPATDTPLYPGDACVHHGERDFADFRALATWLIEHKQAHLVTLPNTRCEVCDSDGCRVEYRGHFLCDAGCFAEWLEASGEGEWGIVQEPVEDRGWN